MRLVGFTGSSVIVLSLLDIVKIVDKSHRTEARSSLCVSRFRQ